jgi:hypothetical protein
LPPAEHSRATRHVPTARPHELQATLGTHKPHPVTHRKQQGQAVYNTKVAQGGVRKGARGDNTAAGTVVALPHQHPTPRQRQPTRHHSHSPTNVRTVAAVASSRGDDSMLRWLPLTWQNPTESVLRKEGHVTGPLLSRCPFSPQTPPLKKGGCGLKETVWKGSCPMPLLLFTNNTLPDTVQDRATLMMLWGGSTVAAARGPQKVAAGVLWGCTPSFSGGQPLFGRSRPFWAPSAFFTPLPHFLVWTGQR